MLLGFQILVMLTKGFAQFQSQYREGDVGAFFQA
jgi:hypothetical protein